MIAREAVLGALATVRDPEIDEPLTALGFVGEVRVDGDDVAVRLRLPTYFCAPSFAYLMVEDAREAVAALDGVGRVDVTLDDHFAAAQISAAAAGGGGLEAAFPGETAGELPRLRDLFARKALVARQARLADELLRDGRTIEELAELRLGALDGHPEAARCAQLRRRLGLHAGPAAPAFVLPNGWALEAEGLARALRVGRLVRVSVEGNAGLCRSLLRTRYGLAEEAPA